MFRWVRRAAVRRLVAIGLAFAGVSLFCAVPRTASAQEIEPNEFVPLPAGTNVFLGYYVYGHENSYSFSKGPTFTKQTGVDLNIFNARLVHFFNPIFGMPFGFQIFQIFGSESGAQIAGQSLGSTFGAQNTALSLFLFPYTNLKTGTNFNTTIFLYPPDGSYDRDNSLNVGDNRLRGDVQLGLDQQVGTHFSATLETDGMFYGQNNDYTGLGLKLDATPTYRFQAWANWRWSPAVQTSIGYEGSFGGIESVDGTRDGNRTEEQRIRAAASSFLSPRSQILFELNHDIESVGGFKQVFGFTTRILYVF